MRYVKFQMVSFSRWADIRRYPVVLYVGSLALRTRHFCHICVGRYPATKKCAEKTGHPQQSLLRRLRGDDNVLFLIRIIIFSF